MVKAGVYILVRLAPVYAFTATGLALSMVGAITFLVASGIAISQTNAKRVLAYSYDREPRPCRCLCGYRHRTRRSGPRYCS